MGKPKNDGSRSVHPLTFSCQYTKVSELLRTATKLSERFYLTCEKKESRAQRKAMKKRTSTDLRGGVGTTTPTRTLEKQ